MLRPLSSDFGLNLEPAQILRSHDPNALESSPTNDISQEQIKLHLQIMTMEYKMKQKLTCANLYFDIYVLKSYLFIIK